MKRKSSRSAESWNPEWRSLRNHSAPKACAIKCARSWTHQRGRNLMPNKQRRDFEGCDDDIAKLYLMTAAREIRKMVAAVRSKSLAELQRVAHKLSGSSAFLRLKT